MKNEKIIASICLCGDGWGALAALVGLHPHHSDIVVVSQDKDVLNEAIKRGYETVADIKLTVAKLYICAGYTKIIDKMFLEHNRVINIHYSLLPKYRGLHSTVWAILNNEPYFGLTIHEMNEYIDDGPILYQHRIKNVGQTSKEVIVACNEHISLNLSKIINKLNTGALESTAQNKDDATWVCRRNKDDCLIDFNSRIEYLQLFFRALVEPYPLPQVIVKEQRLEISKYDLVLARYHMDNGRVVNIENDKAWIKVENGFLIVNGIRCSQTKTSLSVREFFNVGQRLR